MLTRKRLKALLHYDPKTGKWARLADKHYNARKGSEPGFVNKLLNRRIIGVDGKQYYSYRLAWFYMTGKWPSYEIDHKDGNSANDTWSNLRDVNHHTNVGSGKWPVSKLAAGVCDHKHGRLRYQACIKVHNRKVSLGYFATVEEAHAAYLLTLRRLRRGFRYDIAN